MLFYYTLPSSFLEFFLTSAHLELNTRLDLHPRHPLHGRETLPTPYHACLLNVVAVTLVGMKQVGTRPTYRPSLP